MPPACLALALALALARVLYRDMKSSVLIA